MFRAPRDNHSRISRGNGLPGQGYRLQSRSADLVYRERWYGVRNAGPNGGDSGGILPQARLKHVPHDDFIHVASFD
jgi:hypothetical protein